MIDYDFIQTGGVLYQLLSIYFSAPKEFVETIFSDEFDTAVDEEYVAADAIVVFCGEQFRAAEGVPASIGFEEEDPFSGYGGHIGVGIHRITASAFLHIRTLESIFRDAVIFEQEVAPFIGRRILVGVFRGVDIQCSSKGRKVCGAYH